MSNEANPGRTPARGGTAAHGAAAPRWWRLDALRGTAMLWMAAYHFAFDLNHFGLLDPRQSPNTDPLWVANRNAILSLFLFCAGLSLAVAADAGQTAARFWRRWVQIAACALLVSAGSAIVFPRSFIFFGVLHGIAVMLVLARWLAPLKAWLWLLAAAALAAPALFAADAFNGPWLNWTGLVTKKPITEDYVPLLPWFGVMLAGLATGQVLLERRRGWLAPAAAGPVDGSARAPAPLRALALLGRWSLAFYMLHQPIFFGLLTAWQALRR